MRQKYLERNDSSCNKDFRQDACAAVGTNAARFDSTGHAATIRQPLQQNISLLFQHKFLKASKSSL
jgi:hypothetical protein